MPSLGHVGDGFQGHGGAKSTQWLEAHSVCASRVSRNVGRKAAEHGDGGYRAKIIFNG